MAWPVPASRTAERQRTETIAPERGKTPVRQGARACGRREVNVNDGRPTVLLVCEDDASARRNRDRVVLAEPLRSARRRSRARQGTPRALRRIRDSMDSPSLMMRSPSRSGPFRAFVVLAVGLTGLRVLGREVHAAPPDRAPAASCAQVAAALEALAAAFRGHERRLASGAPGTIEHAIAAYAPGVFRRIRSGEWLRGERGTCEFVAHDEHDESAGTVQTHRASR